MKKTIFLCLAMTILAATTTNAQRLSVTATKRNSTAISNVAYDLNPGNIITVEKATSPVITYLDVLYPYKLVTYTVSTPFDTIFKYANKNKKTLVKIAKSDMIKGTTRDTVTYWLYNVSNISERRSVTLSTQPTAKSKFYLEWLDTYKLIYVNETPAILNSRIDSLFAN